MVELANLPDLNTAEIGIISYWNCHDHRATAGATIDPSDVISALDTYTLHDNGVNGTYDVGVRIVNVRVKNDGWIIAWIDRTNEFDLDIDNSSWFYKGYYDILYNWITPSYTNDTNTLIEAVTDMYNQLSNSGDFNFVKSHVGTFCYEFPATSTISFGWRGLLSGEEYLKFIITSGTILNYLVLAGTINESGSNDRELQYLYDSTYLCRLISSGGYKNGTYDVLGNDAYDTDTELSAKVFSSGYFTGDVGAYVGLLALWS